jgi:hypothetical protein
VARGYTRAGLHSAGTHRFVCCRGSGLTDDFCCFPPPLASYFPLPLALLLPGQSSSKRWDVVRTLSLYYLLLTPKLADLSFPPPDFTNPPLPPNCPPPTSTTSSPRLSLPAYSSTNPPRPSNVPVALAKSSATSVRAAESSARTPTTVSRPPSSVPLTLPSATVTSVVSSRRSSTTPAGAFFDLALSQQWCGVQRSRCEGWSDGADEIGQAAAARRRKDCVEELFEAALEDRY